MDEISIQNIDEILSKNPSIINISGNTDPTYSSSEFCNILIDFNGYLLQTGGRFSSTKEVLMTKKEWIMTMIREIHPEYEIRKMGESYKIDRLPFDENFGGDYGGTIIIN